MGKKVKRVSSEMALARILESLEQELMRASDEEILEAARDLGMKPWMKGSAAFLGLTYFAKSQWSGLVEPARELDVRLSPRLEIVRHRKNSEDE